MCAKKIINHPRLPFDEWFGSGIEDTFDVTPSSKTPVEENNELVISDCDREAEKKSERVINYISFGSGSSGNSCYVGTKRGGILIDAGIKTEDIQRILSSYGVSMTAVKALLLTHDHSDHVKYAYNILRNNKHLRLFCTNRVLNGLLRRHNISKRIKDYHNPIFKEIPFKICDFEITAFDVPHDGTDNMGFSIEIDDRKFVLATDLGAVTSRAHHYMSQANYLVIEANYDLQMLRYGPYPEYLKARIQTDNGHMDNVMTARFLQEIINPNLEYIFLCHLSEHNNTPQKALSEIHNALEEKGVTIGNAENSIFDRKADVQVMTLPRFEPSRMFFFRY